GYWTLEIGGSGPAAADWLPEAGAARREDGGLIIVGGFESGDAFADTIWVCSGFGEATADAAGGPTTTAAPALVSEEISLSPSAAAGIGAGRVPGVVFDSCASRVAGALTSDPGLNRLVPGVG